jgi:ABC-type sugar transport system permease subunit
MTRGGPGMANTPITLHIYNNAFVYYKMGLASAMAVLLAIVVLFFTFLQMRLFEKEGA